MTAHACNSTPRSNYQCQVFLHAASINFLREEGSIFMVTSKLKLILSLSPTLKFYGAKGYLSCQAARVIVEKYYSKLTLDFQALCLESFLNACGGISGLAAVVIAESSLRLLRAVAAFRNSVCFGGTRDGKRAKHSGLRG